MVEYILVLVIVVAIILGIIYQFNDAARQWASNYFGDYLACLLETGELPGSDAQCDQLFEEFDLASGRPAIQTAGAGGGGTAGGGSSGPGSSGLQPAGGGGGAGGGSGSGGAADGSGSQSQSNAAGARAGDSGGGGSGAGGTAFAAGGQDGGRFGRNRSFDENQRRRARGGGAGGGESPYTGSTEESIPAGALGGSSKRVRERRRREQLDMRFSMRRQKAEVETATVEKTQLTKKGSSRSQKKKDEKFVVQRKAAAVEVPEPEIEMSFGHYLRYLVIAAIVIALVLLIGGQILQVSKSMD